MLEVIKRLLVLQDRDRSIRDLQTELAGVEPQRQVLQAKNLHAQAELEAARAEFKQLEAERKKSELEAQAKTQAIEKYSLQQFQTKKNEEYRALTHEIDSCKQAIRAAEDRQLDLMEKAETAQKRIASAQQKINELKSVIDTHLASLGEREHNLNRMLAELDAGRSQICAEVEEGARARYERLLKHRGEKVVVAVDRGVCGGCHMTLPPQVIVTCRTDQEVVNCPNCGRILYFNSSMDADN